MSRGLSERRACRLVGLSRSSYHYVPRQAEEDREIAAKLHKLAVRYVKPPFLVPVTKRDFLAEIELQIDKVTALAMPHGVVPGYTPAAIVL